MTLPDREFKVGDRVNVTISLNWPNDGALVLYGAIVAQLPSGKFRVECKVESGTCNGWLCDVPVMMLTKIEAAL
jgi:hypothetical protein